MGRQSWPVVERRSEFDAVRAGLTPKSQSCGVLLLGDPGVGKTSLARSVTTTLGPDAHWVAATESAREPSRLHPASVGSRTPRRACGPTPCRGEACALAWSNVDLDGGQLHVRATLSRIGGQLVIGEPKTARARRTVPIPATMVEALRAHRAEQLAESVRRGWRSSLVFIDEHGGPVDPRGVLRVLQDAAKAAKFEDVDVHSLRHSAATGWLNAGVTVRQVADLLGHSDVSVTLNTYVHGSAEGARRAVDGWAGELGL